LPDRPRGAALAGAWWKAAGRQRVVVKVEDSTPSSYMTWQL
jgi:hypothetical protein